MNTSEQTGELAKALTTAQSEMKNAPLNSVNPHFKNRYADLAAIRDVVVPALAKAGIAVTQATECGEGPFRLLTRITHSSGEWMEGSYPLTLDKPQAMGSQMTYARRYSLSAMCGISADEDDDAEGANRKNAPATSGKISSAQASDLRKLIIEADADLPKFLKAAAVKTIDELPTDKFEWAGGLLRKKIAALGEGQ